MTAIAVIAAPIVAARDRPLLPRRGSALRERRSPLRLREARPSRARVPTTRSRPRLRREATRRAVARRSMRADTAQERSRRGGAPPLDPGKQGATPGANDPAGAVDNSHGGPAADVNGAAAAQPAQGTESSAPETNGR